MLNAALDLIRRLGAPAVVAILLGAPWLASAQVDPPGRVGRVAALQGTVWVLDGGAGNWIAADRNWPVTAGDRYVLEDDARAELRVGSTVLRVDGGSEIEMSRLDDDLWRVQLHRGAVALRVLSSELAAEVEIVTAEAAFQPLEAGHYRVDRVSESSLAGVWRGDLRVLAPDNLRQVGAGERVEVWRDSARGFTRTRDASLPPDRLSAWALAAEREGERSVSSRHVSPEMTGAEDLDRFGRWEQHPEHGAVWAPLSVPPGWAPYRDGRWAWVRPWGWTWVDAAPWGFAPFHYGRWLSWRGHWVWWPGGYVERPVYAPALVAWIGGPGIGVSIRIGGPTVGWLPLAPYETYRPAYPTTPVYVERINRWPDHRRHGDDRRGDVRRLPPERQVPTGPVMYSNQGVPGAVTVVPSDVLRSRRPVAAAVVPEAGRQPIPHAQRVERVREAPAAQPLRPIGPAMTVPMPAPERARAREEARREERADRPTERQAERQTERRQDRVERDDRKGRDEAADDETKSRRDQRRREQAK